MTVLRILGKNFLGSSIHVHIFRFGIFNEIRSISEKSRAQKSVREEIEKKTDRKKWSSVGNVSP